MKDILEYKGFRGSIEPSIEDGLLFGRVLFIEGLIAYSGENIEQIKEAFEDAVDEYLADCVERGVSPQKPYSGSLNIRIGEELHRQAAIFAYQKDVSLNEFIRLSIAATVEHKSTDYVVQLREAITSINKTVVGFAYLKELSVYRPNEEKDTLYKESYYFGNELTPSEMAH